LEKLYQIQAQTIRKWADFVEGMREINLKQLSFCKENGLMEAVSVFEKNTQCLEEFSLFLRKCCQWVSSTKGELDSIEAINSVMDSYDILIRQSAKLFGPLQTAEKKTSLRKMVKAEVNQILSKFQSKNASHDEVEKMIVIEREEFIPLYRVLLSICEILKETCEIFKKRFLYLQNFNEFVEELIRFFEKCNKQLHLNIIKKNRRKR